MAVENATYVVELDINRPDGATDPKSEGDDQLKVIKKAVKNTLPNAYGPDYRVVTLSTDADYVSTVADNGIFFIHSKPNYRGFHLPVGATLHNGWWCKLVIGGGHPQVGIRTQGGDVVQLTELFAAGETYTFRWAGYWIVETSRINMRTARQDDIDSLANNLFATPGTRLGAFHQAAAPAGWVNDASMNDRVFRVNSAGGGGAGGSWVISGLITGDVSLTEAQLPVILPRLRIAPQTVFAGTIPLVENRVVNNVGGTAGYIDQIGAGQPHSHAVGSNGSWRPAFADVLICQKL